MNFLSAWGAYTGSTSEWLSGLLETGDIHQDTAVWSAPDGSYAVGDDYEWAQYKDLKYMSKNDRCPYCATEQMES